MEFYEGGISDHGLTLYLMVGLNGGTDKKRKRYKDIDERLYCCFRRIIRFRKITAQSQKGNISSHI